MQHPQLSQNGSSQMDPTAAAPQSPAAESQTNDGAMDRRVLLGFAGLAGVAALAKLAQAGPLEPPAGPIMPTGATLSELRAKTSEAKVTLDAIERKVARTTQGFAEPRTPITACPPSATAQFVITEPGAYYLPSNLPQVQGQVCIDIQCSDVDIDGQGFSFVGTGNSASPPSTCIRASLQENIEIYDCSFSGWIGPCVDLHDCDQCAVSDVNFRRCTCPNGLNLVRAGIDFSFEDCKVSSSSGGLLCGHTSHFRNIDVHSSVCVTHCGDSCCVEDCTFSGSTGGTDATGQAAPMLRCGSNCCVCDCDFRNCSCPAGECGSSCVIECCEVSSCAKGWTCQDKCLIDDCTFVSLSGSAVTCAAECCITECDFRTCSCPLGSSVVFTGASCVVECCEVTGGSSSCAITCDSNSSVEDCSVINHQGAGITCASSCCVCECRCVGGFSGISCGADCDIDDNEVSVAPSNGTIGGGPAISVLGGRGRIVCNYVKRGGITLFDGANGCTVEDNTVMGGDGPPGTDGGSIVLASTVTGCRVSSNTVRRASMTNAFVIPPGNSFGPVVNSIAGGDLSTLPGGNHPQCNCVHL